MECVELIMLNVLDTQPWHYRESAYGWATEDKMRNVYAEEIKEKQFISSETFIGVRIICTVVDTGGFTIHNILIIVTVLL